MKGIGAYVPRKAIVVALAIFLVVTGYRWFNNLGDTTITAYFANADGLYQGDDVKILGVSIGSVTGIYPEATDVRVTLRVGGAYKIPAGARAAVVSPSLVSGRFVQLAPAYTTGPTLRNGDTIPISRTAVPLSFDDVKKQLTQLSTALAPQGSPSGPLTGTLRALQANLRNGNADALRTAIVGLRDSATTLSDGRGDLFTTIANLNSFTQNLAVNDAAVAGFTNELSSVSSVLAANRQQLTQALSSLGRALGSTGNLLHTNRARIKNSVRDLTLLSAALADRSNELAGVLHVTPTALFDLHNTIENQALTGRQSLTGLNDAAQFVCGAVLGVGGTAQQCRNALEALATLESLAAGHKQTATAAAGTSGLSSILGPTGLTGSLSGITSLLPGLLGTTLGALK